MKIFKNLRLKIYNQIPNILKFTLSSFWENIKGGRRYYSQNGEDVVLLCLFKKKNIGFYLDIGAHHPKKYSNTFLLHKKGWRGINIDANPLSIKAFNKKRPSDINLNLGVNDKPGNLTYYEFADPAVNTFSKEQAEDWINNRKWNEFLGTRRVKVENINTILDNYLPNGTSIDLLSIDVEGLDLKILKSLNLDSYAPKVIVVEDKNFAEESKVTSPTCIYLSENGYSLHCALDFSLIFKQC